MTVSSLSDTLRALHQHLPERVPYAGQTVTQVLYAGAKRQVRPDEPESFVWLEYALREECDTRGWYWWVGTIPIDGLGYGQWYLAEVGEHSAQVGTPAHALALALLGALGGEGA